MNRVRNVGVAAQIGTYSDAIEVDPGARWLISSGTPGITSEGKLPEDFATQATLAWEHCIRMLRAADMEVGDLVKITQYLTRRSDLELYRPIRAKFLGQARPASMLSFVSELVWPNMYFELEIMAAKAR